MSTTPALLIKGLSYDYRSHWTYLVKNSLHPFDLDIQAGESFGFLGHNGAGKTTTIKCILGLIKNKSGTVSIFGKNHTDPSSRVLIGYIPEQPYFYDNITVKETVTLYATLAGVEPRNINKAVVAVLERVGLADRMKSPLRSLSKGLMQRVALAQAIVNEPKLLILDEPFSGLDPIGRREFRDIFEGLKRNGTTLFLSSHILSDVEALCSRVSIMVKGRLQGVYDLTQLSHSGTTYRLMIKSAAIPEKLRNASSKINQLSSMVFELLSESKEQSETLIQQAVSEKIEIISFDAERPTLEKLFIQITSNARDSLKQQEVTPHA